MDFAVLLSLEFLDRARVDRDHAGDGQQFLLDLDDASYLNEGASTGDVNTESRFLTSHLVKNSGSNYQYERMLESVTHDLSSPMKQRRIPGNFGVFASQNMEAGTELLGDYGEIHSYKSLFWYEKMCYHSFGFWGYLMWL